MQNNFAFKLFIFDYICRIFRKWKNNNSNVHIMDLPEEIWLLIFKNLDTAELISSVRLVCQDWRRVVGDASLYTYPVIDFRVTKPEASFVLRKYRKSIVQIDVRHRQQIVPLLDLISKCENLRILRFDYCSRCENLKTRAITDLFSKCDHLSKIVFMFELTATKLHQIAVLEMIFSRSTSAFTANIYTKEGWQKNTHFASVNVRFRDAEQTLPNTCLKTFTSTVANEIFGIPRVRHSSYRKITSAPQLLSIK